MKYDLKTTLIMIGLFFLSQIVGLTIIYQNFQIYGTEVFESEEVISDTLYSLPLAIVVFTLLFLLIYKLNFKKLLIVWYGFAFIICVTISLSAFINEFYALFVAACLFLLKITSRDNYFHNMVELLIYGGIAVVILPLLSTFSAIILLILISIYDYIAVRMSKHMIKLAKAQFELNVFSGLKVDIGNNSAILGGGDIAFPLILAGVVFRDISLSASILVMYGALVGLVSLILLGKENKFYPAMPFISAGCFLGLIINSLSLFY